MSEPREADETDALLARADRLLARHHARRGEVPVLTDPVPAGDDIPVLTDIVEAGDAGALPPAEIDRAVERALAGVPLDSAKREEVRKSLQETLHAQMKKLHANDSGAGGQGGAGSAMPPV